MGAPTGNKNAVKNKPWEEALRRALLADNGQKLRTIAERVIAKAEEGDMAAIREIGDRLDGKPTQAISGPDGEPLIPARVSDEELARWLAFETMKSVVAKAKAKA